MGVDMPWDADLRDLRALVVRLPLWPVGADATDANEADKFLRTRLLSPFPGLFSLPVVHENTVSTRIPQFSSLAWTPLISRVSRWSSLISSSSTCCRDSAAFLTRIRSLDSLPQIFSEISTSFVFSKESWVSSCPKQDHPTAF